MKSVTCKIIKKNFEFTVSLLSRLTVNTITFKVFETWVVLFINELDYPSFEDFESHRIFGVRLSPNKEIKEITFLKGDFFLVPRG